MPNRHLSYSKKVSAETNGNEAFPDKYGRHLPASFVKNGAAAYRETDSRTLFAYITPKEESIRIIFRDIRRQRSRR